MSAKSTGRRDRSNDDERNMFVAEESSRRKFLQKLTAGAGIAVASPMAMLFTLRNAFVQTLQAKQLLLQAQANLDYYGKELAIFRTRFQSGAIARVDLDRMLLQRVQYESDYQGALVNARTAKITLR